VCCLSQWKDNFYKPGVANGLASNITFALAGANEGETVFQASGKTEQRCEILKETVVEYLTRSTTQANCTSGLRQAGSAYDGGIHRGVTETITSIYMRSRP
jgi:hypothetical protein